MKKALLAFLLLAFISVGFSATVKAPVEKQVKKEFVKVSENIVCPVVFVQFSEGVFKDKSPVLSRYVKEKIQDKFDKTLAKNGIYKYGRYWNRFNHNSMLLRKKNRVSV